jgi:endonuclease-8
MPEGPEIKIAADEIAQAIAGRVATKVFFAYDHLKPYENSLSNEVVTAVEARGKAILIRFANRLNIYSHNQLYGQWLIHNDNGYPSTNRQLRLAIHNQHQVALLYSASDIEVLPDHKLGSHPFLSRLGPDPLNDLVTVGQVVDRLRHKQFYRRKLATLLLDQHFLAGLGNYLRSEVLFVGRTHPSLRPIDCSPQQIRQLAEAALTLTRQSYQTKGLTNDLKLVERLQRDGYKRSQYRFWVFNRDGQPCHRCGTSIIKARYGGRRLYFCPTCQKEGKAND